MLEKLGVVVKRHHHHHVISLVAIATVISIVSYSVTAVEMYYNNSVTVS